MLAEHPHPQPIVSPRGAEGWIYVRDGTSDLSVALGSVAVRWADPNDEYGLGDRKFSGVFVDIGAHIGAVSLSVLLDNPDTTAILVEPIPENLGMARQTMAANGLSDRCTFVEAAVGKSTVRYGGEHADDRFVGNMGTHDGLEIRPEKVTLAQIVKMAGGHIDALKTDCEGGEWAFLRGPLDAVDYIFGEWHGHGADFDGPTRLHQRLDATHDITGLTDVGGIGLFWAVRR